MDIYVLVRADDNKVLSVHRRRQGADAASAGQTHPTVILNLELQDDDDDA